MARTLLTLALVVTGTQANPIMDMSTCIRNGIGSTCCGLIAADTLFPSMTDGTCSAGSRTCYRKLLGDDDADVSCVASSCSERDLKTLGETAPQMSDKFIYWHCPGDAAGPADTDPIMIKSECKNNGISATCCAALAAPKNSKTFTPRRASDGKCAAGSRSCHLKTHQLETPSDHCVTSACSEADLFRIGKTALTFKVKGDRLGFRSWTCDSDPVLPKTTCAGSGISAACCTALAAPKDAGTFERASDGTCSAGSRTCFLKTMAGDVSDCVTASCSEADLTIFGETATVFKQEGERYGFVYWFCPADPAESAVVVAAAAKVAEGAPATVQDSQATFDFGDKKTLLAGLVGGALVAVVVAAAVALKSVCSKAKQADTLPVPVAAKPGTLV